MVQFLKSLFCLQGLDNRTRFFAIASAAYLIFIILISTLTGKVFISIVILLLLTPVLSLTNLRRLTDAQLNPKWAILSNIVFFLAALVVILSEQNSSYYLLLIPIFCSAVLLTYPSARKTNSVSHPYILGYCGPVDLSEYQQFGHQSTQGQPRIEPTLMGSNSAQLNYQTPISNRPPQWQGNESNFANEQKVDLGEVIRLNLLNNKKAQFAIAITLSIILIGVAISWLMSEPTDDGASGTSQEVVKLVASTQSVLERQHPLSMPDNFTLFLSQHQGIIINWQADEISTPLLWSQSSAKGEGSCQTISFNKGKPIRTLTVEVEADINVTAGSHVYNNYFASFSPLDSKALIQALAFRGSFSLCGYDFSLKGSQAALGKNKNYADWVDY